MIRNLPWHNIGKEIINANSIYDAMHQSELDFEVVKNPIFDHLGNVVPNNFATTRTSDNYVLGIVGKNYKIVNNIDAFEFTDSLLADGVTFEKAGQFHNGKASWLLAKMPETDILGDKFDPYIVFINSFDGSGSIKVAMTPIRLACSNALNFAFNNAKRSWSTRHIGDIHNKLEEAKYTLDLANNYIIELEHRAQLLASKKMSDAEFEKIFNKILPIDYNRDSVRKIRNIETIKETMMKSLNAPDLANFTGTAWQKINAVTDTIDHIIPARMTESYAENNWAKIATGHNIVDAFYREIA